jgi:predicted AlkP superfamily phosphohydrolase/phosphomutase
MKNKKVFIIGLDGLSFEILDQVRHKFNLININHILESGASGHMKSVLPYSSAPNWASLSTGVNPGKHGFYSFYFPRENAYEHQFPNSTHIKYKRVWDLVGESGRKALVINVPGTYPPDKINGHMITCMLTPGINSDFGYPNNLADEIREKFPDYSFDINWKEFKDDRKDQLVDALIGSAKTRRDLIRYMLEKYPADFNMIVFTETDRLFHSALNLIDKRHPLFDKDASEKNMEGIEEIFRTIDSFIGEVLTKYADNCTIILISDHGFSPAYKKVYLNNWLSERGLLSIRTEEADKTKFFLKAAVKTVFGLFGITGERRIKLQDKLLLFLRERKGIPILDSISRPLANIADSMSRTNWVKTKAYYLQEWGIRINLKGREPQGIVEENEYEHLREEIIQSIMKLEDPDSGKRIIKEALRREDVCSGEEFANAPDIFLITEDSPGYELTSALSSKNIFDKIEGKTGEHSLYGMFAMKGDNVQKGSVDNISTIDIVPTVLYAFGLPIPDYIDGKVITQTFTEEFRKKNQVTYGADTSKKDVTEEEFSSEDEEAIKDRLKGLGYY